MMDNDKKQEDREATPIVDWSSSPGTEPRPGDAVKVQWGDAAPPPPPPRAAVVPPQPAPPPAPVAAAEPEPTSDAQPAKPAAKRPGRSPLGILAFLALAGYLSWVAAMCYDNLGALHREADRAPPSEVADLQQQHAAATHQLLLNGLGAGLFLLAAVLGVAGWRRVSQLLAMIGIAAVIFLLYWVLGEGRAYMNGEDVLVKTIMVAVAAWFA
jgi:hypothetical protein